MDPNACSNGGRARCRRQHHRQHALCGAIRCCLGIDECAQPTVLKRVLTLWIMVMAVHYYPELELPVEPTNPFRAPASSKILQSREEATVVVE